MEWRDIPGFEGLYQANAEGQIRGLKTGKILKPNKGEGYYGVTLSKNGVLYSRRVHVLVALTFIGERPRGYDVNHIDLDKSNNSLANLEYVTRTENMQHFIKNGIRTIRRGEQTKSAKLSPNDVRHIRQLKKENPSRFTYKEIGRMYGISGAQIRRICNRQQWQHLEDESTQTANQPSLLKD